MRADQTMKRKSTDWRMLRAQVRHAVELAARRSPLAPALKALVRSGQPLARALQLGREQGWNTAAAWLLSPEGERTRGNRELLRSLTENINSNSEVELLLTAVRKRLLCDTPEALRDPCTQEFVCALIQQCLNNEYVFFVSEEEQRRLEGIARDASPTKAGFVQKLVLLLMYRPFHQIVGVQGEQMADPETLPSCLRELVQRHLETLREEREIREKIRQFGAIENDASRSVAAMYEEFPYPRWVNLRIPAPGSRRDTLRSFFAERELSFMDHPFRVLVAGCGTGRKALQVAIGYGDRASVLGTDLSRSSLAYATRMARKYGVRNIQFLQMDILDVPKLAEQFDIVECTGVLVCMADPRKGWQALVDRTKPRGLMHISLYSELARREIVRIRRETEEERPDVDADFIRGYRHRLMLESPEVIEALPTRGDFFDLSRCKDLLFHILEHRFTIPELKRYFSELDLEFRGFEQPRLLENKYWSGFPNGADRTNLDRWWEFEQNNPDTFADLYEMWLLRH
jgi:SAM-dependent methyltransferase